MIAILDMYERPETAAALDRLWAAIRDELFLDGIEAPDSLTRGGDREAAWQSPDLVLGQTCSLPYRLGLHEAAQIVGAFDHGLEGCPPGHYRSAVVVRADEPRTRLSEFGGARFAVNSVTSQSGWAALAELMQISRLRAGDFFFSGGHAASARAVAKGQADIAAIDAVTWRLLTRHEADLAGRLRVLLLTHPGPGLPLITARGRDADAIAAAVARAVATLSPDVAETLSIRGFARIPETEYLSLPLPPAPDELRESAANSPA